MGGLTAPPPVTATPALCHAALPTATSCWCTTTPITISPHPTPSLEAWQSPCKRSNGHLIHSHCHHHGWTDREQRCCRPELPRPLPCLGRVRPGSGPCHPTGKKPGACEARKWAVPSHREERAGLGFPRPLGLAPLSPVLPAGSRGCLPGCGHPLPHSEPPRPGVMTWVT